MFNLPAFSFNAGICIYFHNIVKATLNSSEPQLFKIMLTSVNKAIDWTVIYF